MRCPPPPCRRWCPPNVRRRAAECGASCWLQVAQNMSEEAIVESLHNVFSRPMALVRIARINAACCKRVTRGCRCGGKSLPPWALPAPQLLLLMPRTMRGLCDPLPLFLFCPVLHSSVLLQSSHALSAGVAALLRALASAVQVRHRTGRGREQPVRERRQGNDAYARSVRHGAAALGLSVVWGGGKTQRRRCRVFCCCAISRELFCSRAHPVFVARVS